MITFFLERMLPRQPAARLTAAALVCLAAVALMFRTTQTINSRPRYNVTHYLRCTTCEHRIEVKADFLANAQMEIDCVYDNTGTLVYKCPVDGTFTMAHEPELKREN